MNGPACKRQQRGFAQLDLTFALATTALLVVIAIGVVKMSGNAARLSVCRQNLQQIGKGCLQFAVEHEEKLPAPSRDLPRDRDFWWFYKEEIKSYAGLNGVSSIEDKSFACPLDRGYSESKPFWKLAKYDFGSYNFNGVTIPGSPNIAGWKKSAIILPNRTLLAMEWTAHAPLSWHRSRTGLKNLPFYCDAKSVVAFCDGHVDLIPIYYDGYNAAYTRDPIPGYVYKYGGQ
jgi:prepilin-type processing-associated H-X9-DG protein